VPAQSPVRNTVTVANPGTQSSVAGTVVSLQTEASDSASGQVLAYSAAGLPPGLSIGSSTGVISGVIPNDAAGSHAVTVTAEDPTGATGSASFTWTLHNKVTWLSPPQQVIFAVDTPVSLQIEASDSASGQTLTYTAANLPPGLSINSSTGLTSGTTPSTPGTFAVTVKAQDSTGASASAVFEWLTFPKVTVTNPGSQDSAAGTAVSLQIRASESPSQRALTYAADGLPPGLSINSSTGLISGTTPSTAGSFTVTVLVEDPTSRLPFVSTTFSWVIRNVVTVTNPGTQVSTIDTAVSLQIRASDSGSRQTLIYAPAGLPPGLSMNSLTGLISGTPSAAGEFSVTVTAQEFSAQNTAGSSGSAAFTWTVHNKVFWSFPPEDISIVVDTEVAVSAYEAIDSVSGQTLTYTAAGLPPGLSIDRSTGVISGTSSTPGIFTVTVTGQDTTGASGSTSSIWFVSPKVTVTNPGSQDSATATAVSLQIRASESPSQRALTYAADGLPPGLSINSSTGLISGTTPSTAGSFTVTVLVQDPTSRLPFVSTTFSWVIRNVVTVTNPGTQVSTIDTAVSLQIRASDSGSGQTLTYTAAGLPPGLSIDSSTGVISGTPNGAGQSSVTVTAQDTSGSSGSAAFTWFTSPKVTVTNPGTQASAAGTAVGLQIKASDSASGQTLAYAAAGLPPGLSINSATGLISGTPSKVGDFFAVTVTAQGTTGASGSAAFTWIVRDVVTVTNPGTQDSAAGTAVSLQIHASDSASGQTLTYTAAGLPPGLSINRSTGLISGTIPISTPASAPATVEVTAEDTTGASGSAVFGWIVRNLVTLTNPGTQSSNAGTEVSLQVHATDSDAGQTLTYTAANLPPGLSINPSTGLISGPIPNSTPIPPPGTVTVTARDSTIASGSTTFTWTVAELG
jgi:Putative Ig domain